MFWSEEINHIIEINMPPKKAISVDQFEELLENSKLFNDMQNQIESQEAVIDELENRIQILEEELKKSDTKGGKGRAEPLPERKKSIVVGGSNHSSQHPIFGTGIRWHKKCSGRNCTFLCARLYCEKCDDVEIDKKAISLYCPACMLIHVRAKKCLERCADCGQKSETVEKDKGIVHCGLCQKDHEPTQRSRDSPVADEEQPKAKKAKGKAKKSN